MKTNRLGMLHIILCGLLFLIPATAVHAGGESGLYLGGGVGSISLEEDAFDESDTAAKVFVGYNFGIIPLVDLAVEGTYMELGSPGDIDVSGTNLSGLAGLNFGPFSVFAKAGTMNWEIGNTSGSDPIYGLGAQFRFGSLAVRTEYEAVDADGADIFILSASLAYMFY